MPICSNSLLVKPQGHIATLSGLRCKRWSCQECARLNRERVMKLASAGKPNIFMTLTCDPAKHENEHLAAQAMRRGLVALRRRIERKWGVKNVPFIVVFERHKSGWPHMHLLMRAPYMHWKVLRAMWEDITGAFEVDIRHIKKKSSVLFYVTKYIGKQLEKFEGCKRYWRSQNYCGARQKEPKHPEYEKRPYVTLGSLRGALLQLDRAGWKIEKVKGQEYLVEPPSWCIGDFKRRWIEASYIATFWDEMS